MAGCCAAVACLTQTGTAFTCLNGAFTFISSLCRCFGITNYQNIFPEGIPRSQEIPNAEIIGEKPKQTLNIIKELLFDKVNNHIRRVGIYGMGGVGKTTLMRKLNNEFATTSHGFNFVIWVVVSKEWNVKQIQDLIGKRLKLSWSGTEIAERAVDICEGLKKKKFVLLLDDIWEEIDLDSIGIPNVSDSKIVFTTRLETVCGSMGAQRTIKVACLDPKEAWFLFYRTVFPAIETSSSSSAHDVPGVELDPVIHKLAKKVAKECLGLPLALVVIGKALASTREPNVWRHQLSVLRKSVAESPDVEKKVLAILKVSYDNLADKRLKSCFLYCSLYPEDYIIDIEELIDLWICEGFLHKVDDMEEARLEGHYVIGCLKSACLLESSVRNWWHGVEKHGVKMHDVIRDLAIWVASSDLGEINLKDSIQKQLNLRKWESAERISLIESKDISELTGAPECNNLSTLLLRGHEIRTVSDEFFERMPRLEVLSMSRMTINKLPTCISSMSQLRYLNLSRTYFDNAAREQAFIYRVRRELLLQRLKMLNLENEGGPRLDELERLEHEGTTSSSDHAALKPGTFDKLESLKMLDLFDSSLKNWENEGGPGLDELERLENLMSLGLTIKNGLALEKLVTSPKLRSCTKKLSVYIIRGISSISLSPSLPPSPNGVSLANMANLRILHLSICHGLEELRIPSRVRMDDKVTVCKSLEVLNIRTMRNLEIVCDDMPQQWLCFEKLKHVTIWECPKLKDVSWLIYAQHLEILELGRLNFLEIISDRVTELGIITFPKLQRLYLQELINLQRICDYNVRFPGLTYIKVRSCPKLKKLSFDTGTLRKIEGEMEWWESLEWEDETTKCNFDAFGG